MLQRHDDALDGTGYLCFASTILYRRTGARQTFSLDELFPVTLRR
jgi:hypothetical protein